MESSYAVNQKPVVGSDHPHESLGLVRDVTQNTENQDGQDAARPERSQPQQERHVRNPKEEAKDLELAKREIGRILEEEAAYKARMQETLSFIKHTFARQ